MSLDERIEDLSTEDDDWYNRPETFPDFTATSAMVIEGRISGDEWLSVAEAMPEFGDYTSPEEALRQRYAWDVAIRAVAIDRERIAEALDAELEKLMAEAHDRVLSQIRQPQQPDGLTDVARLEESEPLLRAYLSRAGSLIMKAEAKQEMRGTGERRLKVLELTLRGAQQSEIAREIGRHADVNTVKNDRRWLRDRGLLPPP